MAAELTVRTTAGRARALAMSCHPLPTVAVTAITAGLAAVAGASLGKGALLVGAMFTGQLSIGWSNDWIDAARDRASARTDKPAALGSIPVRVVAVAAWTALILTAVLSILLGVRAGSVAFLTVVCGWAYNVGLKASVLSWLPYAIAFGGLPATATLAANDRFPAWWAPVAGAALGVSAHLANVLPDLADDAATGVRGFGHRLGAQRAAILGVVLLLAASGLIVLGPSGRPSLLGGIALCIALPAALIAIRSAVLRTPGRSYFIATVGVAALDLALFGLSGGNLT